MRSLNLHLVAGHVPTTSGRRCSAPQAPSAWRPAAAAAGRRSLQQQGSQQQQQQHSGSSGGAWRQFAAAPDSEAAVPLVAMEGDIVTLNWKCYNDKKELLESSDKSEDPTTFEVGAGDIVGNRLFEAFDEAVRGMAVGDLAKITAEGGEWKQELMFKVPRGHQEIERLEGRYKNHGGVHPGLLVELSNGGMALVVAVDEEDVTLDANNMLAGKTLFFELELASIDRA